MKKASLILTLFSFYSSCGFAAVEIHNSSNTIQIIVDPYLQENPPPYEDWYNARKNNAGNRFGKREYWLDIKVNPIDKTQGYSICSEPIRLARLDLILSKNPALSFENKILQWVMFNCLSIDVESLTIAYPALVSFFRSGLHDLETLNQEINQRTNFVWLPENDLLWKASSGISKMIQYLDPKYQDWPSNQTYREALLNNQVREFDKKIHAGSDTILNGPVLFVTHASQEFNHTRDNKKFSDHIIAIAKQKKIHVVYLMHNDRVRDFSWYLDDHEPDRVYFSKNGEHSVLFDSDTVIMMGGYYNQCLRTSQLDTITRHFLINSKPLTIHLPIEGIYVHDSIDFKNIDRNIFLERIVEGSILGGYRVDDDHGSFVDNTMNLLTGVPNLKDYSVRIFTDNAIIAKYGNGERIVNLKFWSQKEFLTFLLQLN